MQPISPIADILTDLVARGGGTYEQGTYLPFTPRDGFAVAFRGGVKLSSRGCTMAALERWLKAVATEFEASFVGTWLDGDTVYIDAVRYIRSPREAIAFGIEQQQLAIYDFAAGEAVYV